MLLENGNVNYTSIEHCFSMFVFIFRPDFAGPLHVSDDDDDDEMLQEQTKAPSGK